MKLGISFIISMFLKKVQEQARMIFFFVNLEVEHDEEGLDLKMILAPSI